MRIDSGLIDFKQDDSLERESISILLPISPSAIPLALILTGLGSGPIHHHAPTPTTKDPIVFALTLLPPGSGCEFPG